MYYSIASDFCPTGTFADILNHNIHHPWRVVMRVARHDGSWEVGYNGFGEDYAAERCNQFVP